MEISRPWHAHPLFLSDEAKFWYRCSICKKGFDGNPFYACVDCEYYVHKSCAQLPVEIQHHFHPPHPLSLRSSNRFACDSCHKTFRNELGFRCSSCNFDLDVKCAFMTDVDTEGKEFIAHFTHQHPLTICSKDGDNPLNCFACKKTSSDLIYGCTSCDYFLHKSCSELSTHILHAMHPQHALTLVVKFGCCNYCGIIDHTWKYYCSICEYFLDVSCLIESFKDVQNSERSCFLCGKQHLDSDSSINSLYFINQSCIQLPEEIKHKFHSHKTLLLLGRKDFGCDSCHKWFVRQSHYGCEECDFRMDVKCALMPTVQYEESDESIWPVIPPHFNHQHPLHLIREVHDINCSACQTTKLSPMYGCVKCEYFLHQSCLELPIQIEHPLHASHMLTIQPLPDGFCQICRRKNTGFAFGCIQCLFFIGIECIFERVLITTVVHKHHPHLLYLIEKSSCDPCKADNPFCKLSQESIEFKLTESYSLRCLECNYVLHLLCGPLSCTIKHKSHFHALNLVDSIVEDDSDEYYCDICEEMRNPRLCVYYCEDCKFFTHVHCVISEIINAFKKNPEKIVLRIVGDLRLEDSINPLHDNLSEELLLDLLERLDKDDMDWFRHVFDDVKLFPDRKEPKEQNSSSDVNTRDIIEELSFYDDDIFLKLEERLKLFKPYTKYHIQPDECQLPVTEVKGHKVISNFASLFGALLTKYGDFSHSYREDFGRSYRRDPGCSYGRDLDHSYRSSENKNVKFVFLYFLCRIVSDMRIIYIGDINEKQLFTWLYYMKRISRIGFDLEFVKPFLQRITRSYFGLRAMKFEDECTDRLDCEIVKAEEKIFELKTKIEEMKGYRQRHRPGKIVEESKVMKKLIIEAKQVKHKTACEGIV